MTLWLYFSGRLLKNFMVALLVSSILFFVIDSLESSKMLMDTNPEFQVIASLFWAKLKLTTFQILPLALLISVVLTVGTLEMKNEITAVQAGGINPLRIVGFTALFAIPVAVFMVYMQESVVPPSSRLVDEITTKKLGRYSASWGYFHRERNWFRGSNGNLFRVQLVDQAHKMLWDVQMVQVDSTGLIKRIVRAVSAADKGDMWLFRDAEVMDFTADSIVKREKMPEWSAVLKEKISDFRHLTGRPQQMTYGEIDELIKYRQARGIDVRKYVFERYSKTAYPVSVVVIAIAGAMCVFLFAGGVSLVRYLAYATVICFIYWIFYSGGSSACESGTIRPMIGAWLPNMAVMVFFTGVYVWRTIRPV